MQPFPNRRSVKWILLTVFAPLSVSLFAANAYLFVWYARMAAAGTPHDGAPPTHVILRGVMLTAGVGLWFTVLFWWFLWHKASSFGELFATRSRNFGLDLLAGVLLGACW